MDRTGRIVVPIELRHRLNFAPGARLMLDVVAQRIELTPELQVEAGFLLAAGRRTVFSQREDFRRRYSHTSRA